MENLTSISAALAATSIERLREAETITPIQYVIVIAPVVFGMVVGIYSAVKDWIGEKKRRET